MLLLGIDHVAITVADMEASCAYYDRLFGTTILDDHRVDGRPVVRVIIIGGGVRFSIHQAGNGIQLVADRPTVGSVDICLRWSSSIEDAVAFLGAHGVTVIDGPSPRRTAQGQPAQSIYFRDPDNNLVELMAADWDA